RFCAYRTRAAGKFRSSFAARTIASYVRSWEAVGAVFGRREGEAKMKSGRARIGELLSRMVPLSGHDVEEILQEQSATRRRFGEIALAWGLCKPEHVWDAWGQQSTD